ncbi:MAG TPA: response regulator transcription factor [Acidimicrobiales bacterium]|nr:response regulator transcription factor [Acidimicrobiales bacterium]
MRLLLVEDEAKLAASLKRGLSADGFAVEVAVDGKNGLWLAQNMEFDIILLDLMLPGMSGFSVCSQLREARNWTPVLVLTAKTGEFDEIESLDVGADDFLTKPFSYPVLLARIRSLLRRGVRERPTVLETSGLRLDPASRSCWRGSTLIELTPREFDLLEYLMRYHGQAVTKSEILNHVWDPEYDGNSNIVEVYVGYLRRKVDRPFGTETIVTVPGSGYRLDDSDA